jgi:hypothetical protein
LRRKVASWVKNFDSSGILTDQSSVEFRVVSDTVINNESLYVLIASIGQMSATFIYCNKNDGLYYYSNMDGRTIIFYKYPGFSGEKYKDNSSEKETIIENTKDTINTTLGNFECYKYVFMSDDISIKNIHYLSSGIGVVNREIYKLNKYSNYYLFQKFELIEYGTIKLE